jgi:hypothetical protein
MIDHAAALRAETLPPPFDRLKAAALPHCIAWSCLMNGSNSLPEADARPLELCPSCMAKLCRALDLEPVARAGELAKALDGMGLAAEAQAERKLQSLLAAKPN